MRTLQRDGVLLDGLDGRVRNNGLAILQDRRDADFLPLNGNLPDS